MASMSSLPPAIVFILGAVVLPLLPRRLRSAACLALPLLAFIIIVNLDAGASLTLPVLNHELVLLQVDRLSLAFGYVFVVVAFLGGIYGFHLKDTGQQIASLLYVGGSLGVVFAGDLLTLFVFWKVMLVGSSWLIWSRRTAESGRAGLRYFMVHFVGGILLLAGIWLHVDSTGSLLVGPFAAGTASYLILIGFALNAAVPPLHAWLPDAYPEGTATGSVFLSAFTTKVAVYALIRCFSGFEALIWAGTAMAIYGVVFAILQNDVRRLLSYHIISQVGYMVAAVGIGTAMAINGATAHAFNNMLYKGLLFMGTGVVLHTTGRSKLTELGGLARAMPLTLTLYMIGAFSISGFPLFSGFISKSMVSYAAGTNHMEVVVLLLYLVSIATFLSVGLKLPYFTWFGPDRSLKPGATPPGMYLSMALTAGLCIAIGVYPSMLYSILPFTVDYQPYTAAKVVQTVQLLAFTGLGFWLLVHRLAGKDTITLDTDWFYRRLPGIAYGYACRLSIVSRCRQFYGLYQRLPATAYAHLVSGYGQIHQKMPPFVAELSRDMTLGVLAVVGLLVLLLGLTLFIPPG